MRRKGGEEKSGKGQVNISAYFGPLLNIEGLARINATNNSFVLPLHLFILRTFVQHLQCARTWMRVYKDVCRDGTNSYVRIKGKKVEHNIGETPTGERKAMSFLQGE